MQVNSCVLKHLFLEGVQQPKKSPLKPLKCCLRRATSIAFSKFRGWRCTKHIYICLYSKTKEPRKKSCHNRDEGQVVVSVVTWSEASGLKKSVCTDWSHCYFVLQCVAVHCSVLQLTRPTALSLWVAVCCSVLQYVAAEYIASQGSSAEVRTQGTYLIAPSTFHSLPWEGGGKCVLCRLSHQ